MSLLFTPIRIGNITYKNRLFLSPMCQYSSEDGFANDWHLVHLGSRAVGQTSLIIQEATAVAPEGRISPDDLGLWKDDHIHKLKQIVDFVHQQDAKIGIQLAHAGRKASTASPWKGYNFLNKDNGGWQTIAPSALPFNETDDIPLVMTKKMIDEKINDFRIAAKRAVLSGYDVIEIHAAHGYLIHQFLSPITNKRTDEYGGSFENRIRLLMEIIEAVQSEMNEQQNLFVRISATDYIKEEASWDLEQSIKLSKLMEEKDVDLVDVSSGAIAPNIPIEAGPGYQVPFADGIKRNSDILVGTVGIITDAQQAEDILTKGSADVILLGRASLRDPYIAMHWAQELDASNVYPKQYLRGFRK